MWPEPFATGHAGLVEERLARRRELAPGSVPGPDEVRVPAYLPDRPEVRADIARFYEGLALVDREVGGLLEALDRAGVREDTVVIYLTDHGRGLPREKRWCYGAGVHGSLVVRAPGLLAPGTVSDELVSWIDLAPTILSLAGVEAPPEFAGRVFLGPQRKPERTFVAGGRDRMAEAYDRVRFVADGRMHYIRNFYPDLPYAQRIDYMERMPTIRVIRSMQAAGELEGSAAVWMAPCKPIEELYDRWEDPDMVVNLVGDPAHAADLERLRAALDDEIGGDLGVRTERDLIASGVVTNLFDAEYLLKVASLPDDQNPEIYRTRTEPGSQPDRAGPSMSGAGGHASV